MDVELEIRDEVVELTRLAGLAAGTMVMTMKGEVAVEALAAGDRVITRNGGATPLLAVERVAARVAPVRIAAGCLGHGRPERDALVGPGTRLHLRDWRAQALYGRPRALVEAERLVDGEFVTQEKARGMTLHRLVFETPQIVYADGLEVLA